MEKELRDFLQQRGITEEVMLQLENDKIDQNVLAIMTDEQLTDYFPNYGDRIAVVAFVKKTSGESSRQTLIEELRERLRSRKRRLGGEHKLRSASLSGNKNAKKVERRVELGWLRKDTTLTGEYKQVKGPKGGGVKHLSVSTTCPASSLLESAVNLFFPNGVAKSGEKRTDFNFELWDNANNVIDSKKTVNELYDSLKVKLLRVYMVSKLISPRNNTDTGTKQKEEGEPTIHVLTGTPTISFRVRSTDTVGEIEVCPTLDIDTSATGTASLEDSSRTVCAQCSRTYTTESCLMCEQDREYQNSLLIDQQIQSMSTAAPRTRTTLPELDNSLPDISVDLTGDLASIATNVFSFFSNQPNLQSSEVSVGTSEQGIHEQQPSDTHSVETSQDLTDEIRRQRLSFFDRNSSEGNQAMVENQNSPVADTHSEDETCLEDVLQSLYKQIDTEGRKNIVNVDRYNVLEGGFRALQRKAFKETNLLSVKFSGECGVDNGGPSREFLNLSMKSLKELNIFEGDSGAKLLAMDYKAMDAGNYQTAGKLIAYSIVHKGPLPNFMHPLLYRAITEGPNSVQPNVNDVVDYEMRQTLQEILDETVNETVVGRMNKLEDVAALCGCLPLAKMDTKDEFVKRLCHFLVIGRTALPLQRFLKGLETLNVLDSIRKHPAAFKDAFVFNKSQTVTAEKLENLFRIEIKSLEGSNHHRRETRTITMWRDFLQDLEEENLTGKFLRFVTCMESIPPLGFEPAPQLFFGHADLLPPGDRTAEFPYVNTCANTIRLPILDNYEHFKRNMKAAMDIVTTFTNE